MSEHNGPTIRLETVPAAKRKRMPLPRMLRPDEARAYAQQGAADGAGNQTPPQGDDKVQEQLVRATRKIADGGASLDDLQSYSRAREAISTEAPVNEPEAQRATLKAQFEAPLDEAPVVELTAPEDDLDALPSHHGDGEFGFSDYETRLGIDERWQGIDTESSAGRCLQVLLALLGWGGDGRHLAQALPHFNTVHDMTGLRAVLTRLNFVAVADRQPLAGLSEEKLPCLWEDEAGVTRIISQVDHAAGTVTCFNGLTGEEEELSALGRQETIYLIKSFDVANQQRYIQSFGWVTHAASSFRKLFLSLFLINFGINLAAMAVPIFIMAVYGYAIPSKAPGSLAMFVVGIGLIIAGDFALRRLRSRVLAYIGARFDTALSVEIFQRLLYIPYAMVQNATVGSQLSRLRQFEKLREIFLGSFGTAVLDLPFVFVFITAIAMIGGLIAVIPALLLVGYLILALVSIPIAKRHTMQSGDAKNKRQNIMMELFLMHRDIVDVGGEEVWQKRYEQSAAGFAALDFRAQHFSQKVQIISGAMSMLAGLSTLGIGTMMVMSGDLGVGGLIAIMALIWRVLSPLQNAFLSLSRVGKLLEAIRMVNALMRMKPERTPGAVPSISRRFSGLLTTKNMSFRYPQAVDAAVKNANVEIQPGEIVAVTGPSGGGKSTFLKLLGGLYRPVSGVVSFDHLDIRQIDMGELRFEISFQPDHPTFFYGTVEQNIHLNDPKVERGAMLGLMEQFNIEANHPELHEGLDTRLKAETLHQMSDTLKQKLMLCRSFAKSASYYLLDEPANYLNFESDQKLMAYMTSLRGKATVVFTTQRPSHMKQADRILVLHEGQVILNGPPDQVLPQLDAFNKMVA